MKDRRRLGMQVQFDGNELYQHLQSEVMRQKS